MELSIALPNFPTTNFSVQNFATKDMMLGKLFLALFPTLPTALPSFLTFPVEAAAPCPNLENAPAVDLAALPAFAPEFAN